MIAKVIISAFLVLNASAFEIYTYTSKQCTGTSAKLQLGVDDGCNQFRAGDAQAIIMYDMIRVSFSIVPVTNFIPL